MAVIDLKGIRLRDSLICGPALMVGSKGGDIKTFAETSRLVRREEE